MELSVKALEKLLDYTVDFLVEPLLGDWKARREVRANLTRALGEARANQILAIGRAVAEVEAQKVRALTEAPTEVAPGLGTDELDRRIQRNLERRLGNIAAIVDKARLALPAGDVPDVEPDVGWTSSFSSGAQGASSDEMQDLWARILAGEIASPGCTSVRTLAILRNLDQSTAQLFKRLCSLAVSIRLPDGICLDHRVISIGGKAGSNSLQAYQLGFDALNVLNEYELIISDYNSWFDYRTCIATRLGSMPDLTIPLGFTYQGQLWGLIPETERDLSEEFRVSGVSLTRAGRELSKVVELEPVPEYDEALRDHFAKSSLTLVPVPDSGQAPSAQ